MFCVPHFVVPFLFLFLCKGKRQMLVGWSKKTPLPTPTSSTLASKQQDAHGIFTPPPPWRAQSPCLIFCCLCMVDPYHSYVWSSKCIHSHPNLALICLFSNCKCLFNVTMCFIFLFPFCSCLFIGVGGGSSGRNTIAQANLSSTSSEEDVRTQSPLIALLPFSSILVHALCVTCALKLFCFHFSFICVRVGSTSSNAPH